MKKINKLRNIGIINAVILIMFSITISILTELNNTIIYLGHVAFVFGVLGIIILPFNVWK